MKSKSNKWSVRDIIAGILLLAFITLMALLGESRNTPITSSRASLLLRAQAEDQQLTDDITNLRLGDPQCRWEGYGHCTVEVDFNINGTGYAGICTYGPFEDDACTITGRQLE